MSSSIVISQEALHILNTTNRENFSRLVLALRLDLAKSLMIMALWLFLQEKSYNKFVYRMVRLSNVVLNGLANEAVQCLKCLESTNCPRTISRTAPNGGSLLLTKRLLGKEISLRIISINRYTLISGVSLPMFVLEFLVIFCSGFCFRTPTYILVLPCSMKIVNPNSSINHGVPMGGIWGWSHFLEQSVDDRTMFLTFSRGFPVSQDEVKELIMELLGSETCVERVQMANVPPDKQPLYAKLVFSSVVYVDSVLRRTRVAKFRINRKHIWARKYERRE